MSLLPINRHPSRRQLLAFGAAWFAILAAVSARGWTHHHPVSAIVLVLIAAGVPLAGLVHPEVLRRAYVGLSLATFPIGWLVSWLVLTLAYYLVLTPIALVMRLLRHDPLQRSFDRSAPTYWIARPSAPPPENYFRQH